MSLRRLRNQERAKEARAKAEAEAPFLRAKAVAGGTDVLVRIEDGGIYGFRATCDAAGCSAMAESIPAALRKLAAAWPKTGVPASLLRGIPTKKKADAA